MINWRKISIIAAFALAGAAGAETPDRLEPGIQGQTGDEEAAIGTLPMPYSKGVELIGHNDIAKRGGNVIMAWSGNCAYVAGDLALAPSGLNKIPHGPTSGVAVVDVRNPALPRVTTYLQDKGALDAGETIHAVTVRGRAILAASNYGGVAGINGPKEGWLSLYDITRCTAPKLMSEIKWPEPVHTLTVSPNGKRVYGTVLNPFTGDGGIQVMDISDMTKPHFIGKFEATRPDGSSYPFAAHELTFNEDERRIYVGVIASKGDDLNAGVKLFPPNAKALGPDAGGFYILDNSDLVGARPSPKMRLIGTAQHAGWHSPALANIAGKPYIVSAGELGACPGAWPRITDIKDERNPRLAGEFRLAMNRPENCPPRNALETATAGVSGRVGTATSHFNDVDSATNTRLGLFPMMYAGLRIADLRDSASPTEIAYFKPGDPCMSHVRYVRNTGHIWFACNGSGFYVLALKPEVSKALDRRR